MNSSLDPIKTFGGDDEMIEFRRRHSGADEGGIIVSSDNALLVLRKLLLDVKSCRTVIEGEIG